MDASSNMDMEQNENDTFTCCAKTTQTETTERSNCINPILNDGNTAPLSNTNTLYDALPVSDTVISNLDVAANITSNEVKQNNCSITMSNNKPQNSQNPPLEASDKKSTSNALSQLLDYGMSSSEDSHSDSDESLSDSDTHSDNEEHISTPPNIEEVNVVANTAIFRENVSSSDSSEYESDSSSSFSDIGACGGTPAPAPERKPTTEKMGPPRTKGELALGDLPPIEELKMCVGEEECAEVGVVTSIIDQLVIVQSLPGSPAYDIDTLFFLNRGKNPLGRVFDVLGPVTEPLYAIRFNSYEQALESGVKTGTPVYCAPRSSQHTSFVFVSELMKIKGSDASWEHNNEPPEVFLDYSDDEEERKARRTRKKPPGTEPPKSSSLERNRKFEKQMNDKNLLMNERYRSQHPPPRAKKKPDVTRLPVVPGPNVGQPPPPPWLVRNPAVAMPRPEFWQPQPYQFAYPPYGPLAMYPARQQFMPAVFHAPQPFNPAVPPPPPPHVLRPQPLSYFPKPRHPPWHQPPPLNLGVGVGVLQPPTQHYGNGSSYTQ